MQAAAGILLAPSVSVTVSDFSRELEGMHTDYGFHFAMEPELETGTEHCRL